MQMKINITAWIETFESTGKLPESRIPCSNETCNTTTTCFGSNLNNKIAKHGGLMNLLTTFKCRDCRSAERPVVAVSKAPRKVKPTTPSSQEHDMSPVYVDAQAVPTRYNLEDAAQVQELTTGACQRPDIYLDNHKACDGCGLYEHCACKFKRLAA